MFEGLTNKGKAHIAKCLAENKPISFVKVKIGDGNLGESENPETFTDIKSLKKEVSIVDKTQEGETVRLLVQIDNTGLETGYFPREIGIYVQDGNQEILYWYINDGTETSWLPPASKSPVKFKYWINLLATNLDTVIVNWSGKELWVDREFLNQELIKKVDKTTMVTGVGALNGGGNLNKNISISHKDEKGFKHIPLGGALKNILKWGSDGIAKWGNLLWEEIDGKPMAMKNPKPLKIKTNGALKTEYIGDTEKELNITSADTGGLMRGALPNYINDENSIFNIISNNGGLDFDSTLLFLNDSGMKQVNKTYLDKNKKGIFKCIKQTAGVVNSTEFFVDISNNASSDKLENLSSLKKEEYWNPHDLMSSRLTLIKYGNLYIGHIWLYNGDSSPTLIIKKDQKLFNIKKFKKILATNIPLFYLTRDIQETHVAFLTSPGDIVAGTNMKIHGNALVGQFIILEQV